MRKTVMKIMTLGMIGWMLWGCGQKQAEVALLQDASKQETSETPTPTQTPEVTPTQIPIIQVTCNCQCQQGSSTDASTTVAPTETTAVQTESAALPVETPVDDKVNINTADSARLQTLNGIGEARARAIISYRETYGSFQSIEDIMNVEGIKDGIFSKIRDSISVG